MKNHFLTRKQTDIWVRDSSNSFKNQSLLVTFSLHSCASSMCVYVSQCVWPTHVIPLSHTCFKPFLTFSQQLTLLMKLCVVLFTGTCTHTVLLKTPNSNWWLWLRPTIPSQQHLREKNPILLRDWLKSSPLPMFTTLSVAEDIILWCISESVFEIKSEGLTYLF